MRQVAAVVLAFGLGGVWILLPPRRSDPRAPVQSVVLDAQGQERPYPLLASLADLLPESELIRLSTLLRGALPLPVRGVIAEELREQGRLDNPFVREYRHLRRRGLERHLHAVHALQLLQQLGYYRDLHHFVLLRPPRSAGPAPLVVFLHGFLGNFQFYPSMLSELGDAAVLIPSTGDLRGLWTGRDLARILSIDVKEVERRVPIDRGALHLVGLSNGGSGVTAALRAHPRAFRSFTFLSTTVSPPPEALGRDRPLGVIYGTRDSIGENNRRMVRALRAGGYPVRAYPFEGERHFVMLMRREQVLAALREITAIRPP